MQREVSTAAFDNKTIAFLCIGTDRSTGDSYGPLVGTFLSRLGYPHVYGTIDDPVHAVNIAEVAATIPTGHTMIAIDGCLGNVSSIGEIWFKEGPLRPGAGVGKKLGSYGDYRITACVNVGGFMPYFVLQNTRFSNVMALAERTVAEIKYLMPLSKLEIASSLYD
jgi:putative sporulation protein YyaC